MSSSLCGVMVSVLTSNEVYHEFKPLWCNG